MSIHATRQLNTALRQIKRWGGAGKLNRDGVRRDCWLVILDYKPRDENLRMIGAKRCLIAAKGLAVAPDRELDLIEFKGQVWRIVAPIGGPRPNGVAVFYECEVAYDSSVA